MNELTIQCWCEEAVPPYAILQIKEVMNPIVLQEPVLVVTKPLTFTVFPEDAATGVWIDPEYNAYEDTVYACNLRTDFVVNGPIAVPEKVIFACPQAFSGIHWIGYNAQYANPDHLWFYPRTDLWHLASSADPAFISTATERVRGVLFRRIGYADRQNKCAPVVMTSWDITEDT